MIINALQTVCPIAPTAESGVNEQTIISLALFMVNDVARFQTLDILYKLVDQELRKLNLSKR